ncbi:16S rRNA (cytosine(967)-C(5))-methyltransferase RsmB [Oscillospiraceae bacterium OttesenSCG-928-F05]|nr:16S rRNA (cytosine(967)-C(5))-methyltransferase RsmB [Oscillospiraceae bacterium OttesenSCG-928-F05]
MHRDAGRPAGGARQAAFHTLVAAETGSVYTDLRLNTMIKQEGLDARDAGFAAYLCYGVVENRRLLDWHIRRFSKIRLKKLETRVLILLRLGAFQLFFADKVPASAAINETVALAKTQVSPKAAGFINALLRRLAAVEDPFDLPLEGEAYLSVRYSHPEWLVAAMRERFGDEALVPALEANRSHPPVTAALNTVKTAPEAAIEALGREGVETERLYDGLPLYALKHSGSVERLSAYREGLFWVQDPAAFFAVLALGPGKSDRVLDMCAAPGGKSFAAALLMEGKGHVLAGDIHPHKQKIIEKGAARLGFSSISTCVHDASMKNDAYFGRFDRVICDVPCSGLGIIRKKPDILEKDPESFGALPEKQSAMLEAAADAVAPGGRLLYSTCTWRREENEDVVDAFVGKHPEFAPVPFDLPVNNGRAKDGKLTLQPHIHGTDGFFICVLVKKDV